VVGILPAVVGLKDGRWVWLCDISDNLDILDTVLGECRSRLSLVTYQSSP